MTMLKEKKIISFFLFGLISFAFFIAIQKGFSMEDERKTDLFDIQLKLYNGKTLSQLIPSVEGDVTSNQELLSLTKYLYIQALYKRPGVAFLTMDIKSPNNPQLNVTDLKLSLDANVKRHEVRCLMTPLMQTSDEDAKLEYKIKDVWFK